MKLNLKRFSEKVKKLTELSQLSQAEMARRIGMQPTHINLFFQGRGDLHGQRLIAVLRELGIDLEKQVNDAIDEIQNSKKETAVRSEFDDLIEDLRSLPRAERESVSLIIGRLGNEKKKYRRGATR